MRKEREIDQFVEGMEMTILSTEEQVLLESGGWSVSGNNFLAKCETTNNCNGGNCAAGCGK